MRAYSVDLRERIVAAVQSGQTPQQTAARFDVSVMTVRRYLHQNQANEGNLAPRFAPGATHRVPDALLPQIEEYLTDHPGTTVQQVRNWLQETHAVALSLTTTYRTLARLQITWKKSPCGRPSKMLIGEPPGATK
jgi:transposase